MLSTDISDPLLVRLELANVPPQAWLNWHETVTLKARRRTKLNSVVSYKSSHVQKRVRISPGAVNHNYRGTHTHTNTQLTVMPGQCWPMLSWVCYLEKQTLTARLPHTQKPAPRREKKIQIIKKKLIPEGNEPCYSQKIVKKHPFSRPA